MEISQEDKLKAIIENRDTKGRFINKLTDKERINRPAIYRRRYMSKYPWAKHFSYAKIRAKRKNRIFNLTLLQIKTLWFRDSAWTLKHPSIDRVNNQMGYVFLNCRFIERSENSRLGNLGRKTSPKQREVSRNNFINYWKNYVKRGEVKTNNL